MDKEEILFTAESILSSKKYRAMQIPQETVVNLLENALERYAKEGEAIRSVKKKLHNIAAPYLDRLEYEGAFEQLKEAAGNHDLATLRQLSRKFLSAHHSTRERLAYMEAFFEHIFTSVGENAKILDLACGLNPFALPLVHVPKGITYYAYDLHQPRVKLIEKMFDMLKIEGKAIWQDILIEPPEIEAEITFLFKEAHRMEKRKKGATRELLSKLRTLTVFLSLPTHSMNGRHNLRARMRTLAEKVCAGIGSIRSEKEFPTETVFEIRID